MTTVLHAIPAQADTAECIRKATAEDVANLQKLNGSNIPIGTCLSQSLIDQIGLNATTLQALADLANFRCPDKKVGYDASVSPAYLKEHNIYFTAPNQGMDPKFLVCADRFLNAAKTQGLNPCITAALRTVAAQRASCLDTANRTVCGRSSGCTSFSMCPHVQGIALDITSQSGRQPELQKLASSMGLIFTLPTQDRVHMQPQSSCRGVGSATTPSQTPGGTTPGSRAPSVTQPDISDPSTEIPDYTPPVGCQAGYVLDNGQCIPSDSPLTCPLGSTRTVISIDPIDVRCLPGQSQSYCQVGYVPLNGQCAPTYCNGSSPYAVTNLDPIQFISCNQQPQQQCTQGFLMINNRCTPFNQNQNGLQSQQGGFPGSNAQGQGGFPQAGGSPFGSQSSGGGVSGGSPTQARTGVALPAGNPGLSGSPTGLQASQSQLNNTNASVPGTSHSTVPSDILDRLNRLTHASDGTADGSSATPQFSKNTTTGTGQVGTTNTPGGTAPDTADIGTIQDQGTGTIASLNGAGTNSNAAETEENSPDTQHTATTGTAQGGVGDASTFGDGRSPSSLTAQRGLLFRLLIELQTTLLGIIAHLHLLSPTR